MIVDGGYWEADDAVMLAMEGVTRLEVRNAELVCGHRSDFPRVAYAVQSSAASLVLDQPTISTRSDSSGAAAPAVPLTGRAPSAVVIAPRFLGAVGGAGRRPTAIFATDVGATGTRPRPPTIADRVRRVGAVGIDGDNVPDPQTTAADLKALTKKQSPGPVYTDITMPA